MVRSASPLVLVALLVFSLPLAARAGSAADVYAGDCATCHGADGKADTPVGHAMKAPPLVSSKWLTAEPDAFLKHVRENPKHKAPMAKLSDDQLRAIQSFLQEHFGGK